jgi:phage gp36-like protein
VGYAVKQDMIDRFGELEIQQLTDKSRSARGRDQRRGPRPRARRCRRRHRLGAERPLQLPLASVPKILVRVACEPRALLTSTRTGRRGGEAPLRRAMKFLDDVAKGIRTIGVDGAGASIAPAAGNGVQRLAPRVRRRRRRRA